MLRLPYPIIAFLLLAFLSCSQPNTEATAENGSSAKTDTEALLQSFITGLWSLDSGNILTNEGFLITPDGNINFVASEISGSWKTPTTDSLVIHYADYFEERDIRYHIDSINESEMILSAGKDQMIFRKVPFGMNKEEVVLSGHSGSLMPGMTREYDIDLPSGKKVGLKLTTKSPELKLTLLDGNKKLAENVVGWSGIVIKGGKYKAVLASTKPVKEAVEFDLKVLSY